MSNNLKRTYASVAIPTFRRSQMLFDALSGILTQKCSFDFEVLILDNACDLTLRAEVERGASESQASLRYIEVPELGLHNGRNIGALEAIGEIVVYVDDDVLVPPDWLGSLVASFANSDVGAVAGRVDPRWEGPVPDWLPGVPQFYFSLLDLGGEARDMRWPQAPHGCNMAIRRNLILEFDGFPPDGLGNKGIPWRRGDGEYGFFRKMAEKGVRVVYEPTAALLHRIPSGRLTIRSVRYRALREAITHGYIELRTRPRGRRVMVVEGIKHILRSIRPRLAGLRSMRKVTPQKMAASIRATDELFVGLYKLRAAFDKDLRAWIARTNYWPRRLVMEPGVSETEGK